MDIIEFTDKFQKIEIDNKFFEEKDSNDLLYWDIARYEIFNQIYYELTGIKIPGNEIKKDKTKNLKYIINFIFGYIILRFRLFYKYKYIFFTLARNIDEKGKSIDIISQDYISHINKQCLIIDSFATKETKNYGINKSVYNYGLMAEQYFSRVIKKIKRNNRTNKYVISEVLKREFNVILNIDHIISEALSFYIISKSYYQKLFNNVKPKAVFLVQGGIQKGLFSAAKNLNIHVIELQHGRIGYVHPAYSYPTQIKHEDLSTLPDTFFSFSNFWTKKINYPVKNILPVGNNLYAFDITFIFANIYTNDLLKVINELLLKKYKGQICIKLHSNQLFEAEFIRTLYKDHDTIHVIGIENSMREVLSISKSIVAIQSTSVYEALHNGLKVFIVKEKDYMTHQDIFDNPNVCIVNSIDDILDAISNDFIVSHESKSNIFNSFNENMFLKFLNDL